MKINYSSAVAAGKQARQEALQNCVEEVRANTELSTLNIMAFRLGKIDKEMFKAITLLDLAEKERIMQEYTNLIHPNTILGVVEQVLQQQIHNDDWPV